MDLEAQRKELDPSLRHNFKVLMQMWRDFISAGHLREAQLIFDLLSDCFAEGSVSNIMTKSNGIRSLSKTLSQSWSYHRAVLYLKGSETERLDLIYYPSTNHEPGLFLPERFLCKIEQLPNSAEYCRRGSEIGAAKIRTDNIRPCNTSNPNSTGKRARESTELPARTKRPKLGNNTDRAKVFVEARITFDGRTITREPLLRNTLEETLAQLHEFADWKNGKGLDVGISFEAFKNVKSHFYLQD